MGWIIMHNNWTTEIRFIDSKEHWVRIIAEEDIKKMLPIALQQEQFRTIIVDSKVQLEVCHPTVVGENYKEVRVGICMTSHCHHHQVSNSDKDTSNINNKDNVNVNNNKAQQRKQYTSTNLYKEINNEIHSNKSNINKGHNVAKRIPQGLITTEIMNNCLETCQKIMKH